MPSYVSRETSPRVERDADPPERAMARGTSVALNEQRTLCTNITNGGERMDDDTTYSVVRMYQSDAYDTEVIARGLTLGEAQAHCQNAETSSTTATSTEGIARTNERGPWFDGYEEER
jgi:hypothetical protein